MVNRVLLANAAWEADAIEACRNDPRVIEAGICPVCMTGSHTEPCLCVTFAARRGIPVEEYHGAADAQLREAMGDIPPVAPPRPPSGPVYDSRLWTGRD